jgi:mRNA interferase MazF
MIRQGEIYLINFGKKYNSEFGKIRPAVVIQNNEINKILPEVQYKSVAVIPLTTVLNPNSFFRVHLIARDNLIQDSDIVCNWVCTIDFDKIQTDNLLTTLSNNELMSVKDKVNFLIS